MSPDFFTLFFSFYESVLHFFIKVFARFLVLPHGISYLLTTCIVFFSGLAGKCA